VVVDFLIHFGNGFTEGGNNSIKFSFFLSSPGLTGRGFSLGWGSVSFENEMTYSHYEIDQFIK
jgi:hypothetical protein